MPRLTEKVPPAGTFLFIRYNQDMDRHYLIDMIHSIMQDAADEWHCKEEISGIQTEIDSLKDADMPELLEQKEKELAESLADYVEGAILRREKLDYVGSKSPAYDFHKRCKLKHRATSFVQATEVYLADPNPTTYDLMWRSEKRFWRVVAQLMGMEVVNCGRCLSDEIVNNELEGDFAKIKREKEK